MKKRIISVLICIFSIVMLTSCGKKNDSNSFTGDEDVEELKAIIEEQQKEIDSLKDKKDKADKSKKAEAKIETYDDDEIIAFTDQNFQKDVRILLGVEDANITYRMVKDVKSLESGLDIYSGQNGWSDISPLKYFTSLEELKFIYEGKDISVLSDLQNLESLDIDATDVTDISPIGDLQNLESLSLDVSDLTDISPIGNLHNLKELHLYVRGISDLSVLSDLNNLESLYLCPVTDLDDIRQLDKLKEVLINLEKEIDISALEDLPNLEDVTLLYGIDDYSGDSYRYREFKGDLSENIKVIGNLKNLKCLRIDCASMAAPPSISALKNINTDILDRVNLVFEDFRIYSVEDLKGYLQSTGSFNDHGNENAEYNPPTLYYVEVTAPDGYVNMRVEPGTDYEIITEINNGEALAVVGVVDDGKWIKVEYNGSYGWVAASQVTEQ